jgi:serine-type D-Ala-D-Ala carboxypeptidase/endopeptidase (penicillin-binding protein 4)
LAITCVDGTLKSRTCGTPAAGKVFAKSGSIDNVVALTGVTATASGRPVTFAFLLNNVRSARLGRVAIDAALNEIVSSSI